MKPARVFLPDSSEPARNSGVFARRVAPPSVPLSITRRIRSIVPFGPFAVLLMPSCGEGLRALCAPEPQKVDDLGLGLAQRLESWLGGDHAERLVPTCDLVKAWLPMKHAAVVRIATVAWDAGAIIVSDRVTEHQLSQLRDLGFELGLELDQADRRACLASMGE